MTESGITFYLWLLVAVFAGWLLAQVTKKSARSTRRTTSDIYHDYFVGLNYLLRDEPDEAVDTFIKGLEVNGETIETHLALGALLRRRGKVDRAIKVHQDLLGRSGLPSDFADSVRLELSNDYIAAGLLDRAERLLKELLSDGNPKRWDALSQLVTVYQIEKEWGQAIDVVNQLIQNTRYRKDKSLRSVAAHYCCELAELALDSDDLQLAREHIRNGFQFDRASGRAGLLLAIIEQKSNNLEKSVKELIRVATNHPILITEVVEPLAECFKQDVHGKISGSLKSVLFRLLEENPRASVLLEAVKLVREEEGEEAAIQALAEGMRKNPSLKVCESLLEIQLQYCQEDARRYLRLAIETLQDFLNSKPGYRCDHCGFETRKLYWQCPSCQKWDRLGPILGAEGD
ncbi:MAG: lipopolysaccharide assembly protein LapB [Gammaproteobacteria bacterium]|nr:lipopolysaccharide assembly protein LapB [Gammaproteobacteria bacterium]